MVVFIVVTRWFGWRWPVHVWVLAAEEEDGTRLWAGAGDMHNASNATTCAWHVIGRSGRRRIHVSAHQEPKLRRPCPKYPDQSKGRLHAVAVGLIQVRLIIYTWNIQMIKFFSFSVGSVSEWVEFNVPVDI